jgi:hypothetical protein
MTESMKVAVFWVVAFCSLVDVYHFRGDNPSDGGSRHLCNVVKFYQTTQHNNPEDGHLYEVVVLFLYSLKKGLLNNMASN